MKTWTEVDRALPRARGSSFLSFGAACDSGQYSDLGSSGSLFPGPCSALCALLVLGNAVLMNADTAAVWEPGCTGRCLAIYLPPFTLCPHPLRGHESPGACFSNSENGNV